MQSCAPYTTADRSGARIAGSWSCSGHFEAAPPGSRALVASDPPTVMLCEGVARSTVSVADLYGSPGAAKGLNQGPLGIEHLVVVAADECSGVLAVLPGAPPPPLPSALGIEHLVVVTADECSADFAVCPWSCAPSPTLCAPFALRRDWITDLIVSQDARRSRRCQKHDGAPGAVQTRAAPAPQTTRRSMSCGRRALASPSPSRSFHQNRPCPTSTPPSCSSRSGSERARPWRPSRTCRRSSGAGGCGR